MMKERTQQCGADRRWAAAAIIPGLLTGLLTGLPAGLLAVLLAGLPTISSVSAQTAGGSEGAGGALLLRDDARVRYALLLQLTGDAPQDLLDGPYPEPGTLGQALARSRLSDWSRTAAGDLTGEKPGFGLVPPRFRLIWNSTFAQSSNDGVLRSGRGPAVVFATGLTIRQGILSARIAPELYYERNSDFPIVAVTRDGYSPFSDPWYDGRIDLPQRPGDEPLAGLAPGQSFMAIEPFGVRLEYGTRSRWWGPARINPLIMSTNAPGFPHLSIGSARALHWGGAWSGEMIWGRLRESEWFDTDPANDERFLSGLMLRWRSDRLPGLTLGATRVYYRYVPEGGLHLSDYLTFFETLFKEKRATPGNPSGDDEADQLLSLFGRWVFPRSGFELYVEWGRNDHNWDLRDFIMEPDHTRALTLGAVKAFSAPGADYYLGGEMTQTGRSMTVMARTSPTWYRHHLVRQGYTHRGQVIGAGIGPGSESQFLELVRVDSRSLVACSVQRIRWFNDAYFEDIAPAAVHNAHDVSMILSLDGSLRLAAFLISPAIRYTWRLNRNFVMRRDAHNLQFALDLQVFF